MRLIAAITYHLFTQKFIYISPLHPAGIVQNQWALSVFYSRYEGLQNIHFKYVFGMKFSSMRTCSLRQNSHWCTLNGVIGINKHKTMMRIFRDSIWIDTLRSTFAFYTRMVVLLVYIDVRIKSMDIWQCIPTFAIYTDLKKFD